MQPTTPTTDSRIAYEDWDRQFDSMFPTNLVGDEISEELSSSSSSSSSSDSEEISPQLPTPPRFQFYSRERNIQEIRELVRNRPVQPPAPAARGGAFRLPPRRARSTSPEIKIEPEPEVVRPRPTPYATEEQLLGNEPIPYAFDNLCEAENE